MFIVSSVGATVLRAEEEFRRCIAPEMKLEDPYARKRKILAEKNINWSDYPTEKEYSLWNKEKSYYIAKQVLLEHGWVELKKFAKKQQIEEILDNLLPCNTKSGQCHMDCKYFGKCEEIRDPKLKNDLV